jgi:hypothetical protein
MPLIPLVSGTGHVSANTLHAAVKPSGDRDISYCH